MEQTLIEQKRQVLYRHFQREPFSRNKQILGAVYALILLVSFVALYTGIGMVLMKLLVK